MSTFRCIYCDIEKDESDSSDEHIWPKALGGDHLEHATWRTRFVCRKCNNIAGVYVDGEFIKSWIVQAEKSRSANDYLLNKSTTLAIPLHYIGPLHGAPTVEGHVSDIWIGPCGSLIVHIRPFESENTWNTYAGGDPRKKRSNAGRVYLMLATDVEFWIFVSIQSLREHFPYADRYVVNITVPEDWPVRNIDREDNTQREDLSVIEYVQSRNKEGEMIHARPSFSLDLGHRFAAKLALGIGFNVIGSAFLETEYAGHLRRAMREADPHKRREIPVLGAGFLSDRGLEGASEKLSWPGGWVLVVHNLDKKLGLSAISPSTKSFTILISDDLNIIEGIGEPYRHGAAWITIPSAGSSVGPIAFEEYISNKLGAITHPGLVELVKLRGDRKKLPPCRSGE